MLMLGFYPAWVSRIMTCVSMVAFSILLNRKEGRIFECRKGELYEQVRHDHHLSLIEALNHYRNEEESFSFLLNDIRSTHLSDGEDRLVFKLNANQEITSSLVWNMVRSKGNKKTWKKLV
ncbi:hypothetical protein EJ110_NYTH02657 [Nymphaea thermarum]|nr:hypothetical protein EJ110_NYTH02657 [Nymphaea thermarum]